MDNSTDNVTLFALFINDVLKNYEAKKEAYKPLFALVKGHDLSDPFNKVPMKLYNDVCAWVENELGKFNLIKIGKAIGDSVFTTMEGNGLVSSKSTPLQIMQVLVKAASQMIQDPKGRGWVILSHTDKSIVMRRTQTFNAQLQLGLLDGLIRRSGVLGVHIEFEKNTALGAEFDEYAITWR